MALIIVDYHSAYLHCGRSFFPYGRLGVEFFFLLSGYLLASSVERKTIKKPALSWNAIHGETLSFICKRFASFFPETFIACLFACLLYFVLCHPSVKEFAPALVGTMFGKTCCLSMSGLFSGGPNGEVWYLSSLLLLTSLLYPFLRRFGTSPALFFLGWLILGMLYINGTAFDFSGPIEIIGTYKGNIRGLAEILIGAALFPAAQKLREQKFSSLGTYLLTLIKWFMFIVVLCYAFRAHIFGKNVGLAILALCVMIVLSFSEKCNDYALYQHPIALFLGRFSLPLYVSHGFFSHLLRYTLPEEMPRVQIMLIYFACSFTTAYVVMLLAELMRKSVPRLLMEQGTGEPTGK